MVKKKSTMMIIVACMCIGMAAGWGPPKASAAAPANTAVIEASKTLTINGTKFPDIQFVRFRLEAVSGYTNPNISTRVDGQTIGAATVPMPEGTQQGSTSVNLDVGDFKAAVSSGDTPDTPAKKVRHGRFGDIEYDTAGYYLYRMTETGSLKNADSSPQTDVPGVSYDESSYYVVVYVVNNIDEDGDTEQGVHVESVTAWHNSKSAADQDSEIVPNLKDIALHGRGNGDDGSGDNNGSPAGANDTYGQNPAGEQRWDGLGKVGRSDQPSEGDVNNENGDDRNVLDAYKFWNSQEMHDVLLTKNVKGNLGDITKQFEFTVTMTGLEKGGSYVIEKTGQPAVAQIPEENGGKGSVDDQASGTTVTADQTGEAVFLVKMSDDQGIRLCDIPAGASYQVSEAASNHEPSYRITSTNTSSAEGESPVIESASGSTDNEKETALATSEESVDSTDGDITIAYTNERNLETITGIPDMVICFAAIAVIALAALASLRKRKRTAVLIRRI